MKIIVTSFSGNVGKSLVANQLLAPRLPKSEVVAVESINADDAQNETLRGDQFTQLQGMLAELDHVIVDVGASNVEAFLRSMRRQAGSHEDFDYFVIPTVPDKKQIRDTLATINALADVGVEANRIRLLFNKVDEHSTVAESFPELVAAHRLKGGFTMSDRAVIHESEVFSLLKGRTLDEVAEDTTDFASLIENASERAERRELGLIRATHRLAKGVQAQFNEAFSALLAKGA